ncbi:MAG: RNA methyltransferase [Ignavibacteria bacterium]|jgi:TrmH family RNA methyltransferase
MISKNELKYFASLLQKKYRLSENKFIAEGRKTVLEGVKSNYDCKVILITEKFQEKEKKCLSALKSSRLKIQRIKSADFRRLSDTKSPEGIAAIFYKSSTKPVLKKIKDSIIVYLEDISDPGNVGTIIRNCDWFGIKTVILSDNCAEVFNPKSIRASTGSIFHINTYEDISLSVLIDSMKNDYKFVCADKKGHDIFKYSQSTKTVLFLSNESDGPSKDLLSVVDEIVTIPGKGKAESLNVASSSAVLLAEMTKQ